MFHPHLRLTFFLGVLLAASVGCGGAGRDFTRIGDDVIGRGPPGLLDSVPGDLIFASREAQLNGTVGGDYLVAAGKQVIGGRVRGSVRAAGGEVHVRGAVDRNATVAGGNVTLDSTGVIEKNAYFAGGDVEISGTVRGGLAAAGGKVTINGVVGRDVQVVGDELNIGPRAQIAGNLRYRVPPKNVRIDSAAHISGTVTALPVESKWGVKRWLWLLGLLLIGVVLVALFPRFSAEASEILPRRPIAAVIIGVGWIFLALLVIAVLWFTVIGRPLAVLTLIAYMVLLFLGDIPVGVWLGRRLLRFRENARRHVVLEYLLGGVVLLAVMLIPVIGQVVGVIATCFGIGLILLNAWGSRRQQTA